MLQAKFHTSKQKLFPKAISGGIFSLSIMASVFSSNAMACDDKACEVAYLASTQQYIYNQQTHAEILRAERLAHAKNRERRAFALYMHIHQTRFGSIKTVDKEEKS